MRPPLLAVALVSAGVLASEVLLTRLFSVVQVHHFASMVISIALLGYGASGSFLALFRERLAARFEAVFALNAALFGVALLAGFALAQRLPFNALALVWEPRQLAWLAALYAIFIVPFFCAANCIGLALACFPGGIGRIYRADLVGAGLGALGVVALLFLLFPAPSLRAVAALGPIAAALALLPRRPLWAAASAGLAAALVLAVPASWSGLRLSEYKGLSRALLVPGAQVAAERSGPLGLVTALRSPEVPFRHAPGVSLANTQEPPEQIGLFVDGEGPGAITRFDGRLAPLGYLDMTTMALPYHLVRRPRVLVLGAGGGADVLLALYHEARRIDAVELDANVTGLVRERFAGFAGRLYDHPAVRVHVAEARGFVAGSRARWDVVQIPLLEAAGSASLGADARYTVEALQTYLRRLEPGGLLAVTRWLRLPPRDSLKLFATARAALEGMGVADPAGRLALVRSWSTTTLLVRNGAFGEAERAAVRRFAASRSFDLAYLPGMTGDEANRYNVLPEPVFHRGAAALAGPQRDAFVAGYKFDLRPATDDRPYFFDFFRWRALPELLRLRAQGGAALVDWGYLVLFATFAQAALLSLLLILLPLWLWRRVPARARIRWRVLGYFLAVGLGFLFVEIASIQRFMLFLGHPVYAVAVVLAAFLVFAGLGSGAAPRLARRLDERRWRLSALELAVAAIAVLALAYLLALPPLFERLIALPDPARIAVAVALIAPLAFWMGMPFPLGLARVAERLPGLVPWAWGVNGCASVLAALLATLLAMNQGFAAVVLLAVAAYAAAAMLLHAPLGGGERP